MPDRGSLITVFLHRCRRLHGSHVLGQLGAVDEILRPADAEVTCRLLAAVVHERAQLAAGQHHAGGGAGRLVQGAREQLEVRRAAGLDEGEEELELLGDFVRGIKSAKVRVRGGVVAPPVEGAVGVGAQARLLRHRVAVLSGGVGQQGGGEEEEEVCLCHDDGGG